MSPSGVEFPCFAWPVAGGPPRHVGNQKEYNELGPGYSLRYVHQEVPRIVHHAEKGSKLVSTKEELAQALKDGYQKEPIPEKEPEPAEDPAVTMRDRLAFLEFQVQNMALVAKRDGDPEGELKAKVTMLEGMVKDLSAQQATAEKQQASGGAKAGKPRGE